ncbi:hypothetical protein [Alicyclobacillus ferrooxydans]|uniref:Uncharacterized protein n=1 Tax=Alicyclobacillus ferrooxydans TaxID=471514 RepID=A0A0P9CAF2_9BACL|nr:hypothetical protein [Alicyclobacillus ferrooxydans]KPV42393.1 hypothetical protein AN477_17440 [Alicyclobacillus ferrooxydans]
MQLQMSAEEVITKIKQLNDQGESLNKKRVKKADPDLMKHALYYYPSWEHAIRETGLELQ